MRRCTSSSGGAGTASPSPPSDAERDASAFACTPSSRALRSRPELGIREQPNGSPPAGGDALPAGEGSTTSSARRGTRWPPTPRPCRSRGAWPAGVHRRADLAACGCHTGSATTVTSSRRAFASRWRRRTCGARAEARDRDAGHRTPPGWSSGSCSPAARRALSACATESVHVQRVARRPDLRGWRPRSTARTAPPPSRRGGERRPIRSPVRGASGPPRTPRPPRGARCGPGGSRSTPRAVWYAPFRCHRSEAPPGRVRGSTPSHSPGAGPAHSHGVLARPGTGSRPRHRRGPLCGSSLADGLLAPAGRPLRRWLRSP